MTAIQITAIEKLEMCRNSIRQIADLKDEAAFLRDLKTDLPEEAKEIAQQREYLEQELHIRKLMHPYRIEAAMAAIEPLEGKARRVLLLYYVMGRTIREISDVTGIQYREVMRFKAIGLEKLRAR